MNFAQGATVARFREPFRASKSRKGRTVRPNPGQTPFRHVVEVKPGISDAAWQGKTSPRGFTVRLRLPQPCRHAFGRLS